MQKIIIVGAGRHGVEVYGYINDLIAKGERLKIVGFIDDKKPAGNFEGSEILGDFRALRDYLKKNQKEKFYYITAVGDNQLREGFLKKINNLEATNLLPFTLIHPFSYLGRENQIGSGTCLAPGSIITTHVKIGQHCIVNVNASVSHDCSIKDFSNINPGVVICGNVKLGRGCFIGAGAVVIDKVTIGDEVVVGAGSVVISNLADKTRVAGVPAKPIN